MYATIEGLVTHIEPSHLVVENQGIGYLIYTPNPYVYKIDQKTKIYTHFHVKEDVQALYGFPSLNSKKMFVKLINVSGIGPKSALSILASDDIDGLITAIEMADVTYLKKFPGIGPKSAQQIILDLKGKLTFEGHQTTPKLQDVEDALLALGYKKSEVSKLIQTLDQNDSVETMIKYALKGLLKS